MSNRKDKRKQSRNYARCECGKRHYTKETARQNAARAGDLTAYRCPFVRAIWHVGHPTVKPITSREEGRIVAAKRNDRLRGGRG